MALGLGFIEGRAVTASSRDVRGRHSTSDLPATPTHLALGFHHGTGEPGSSAQPPAIPFRSQPPFQPHLSHTPVSYEPYGSAQPSSHPIDTVYDPYLHAPNIRPRIPYRSATQEPIVEYLAPPLRILHAVYMGILMLSMVFHLLFLTHRGLQIGYVRVILALRVIGGLERSKKEPDLYILRERRMREEQPVHVALVAHSSGSDGCPRHGKGKGLTDSFMSVMSKIAGSRNKRPEDRGPLKFRSRYMALTGWELTDAHVRPLASWEQLVQLVQDDLGLALTDCLGFNATELHAVATSRQTSLPPCVRAGCYLQYILGSSLFSDKSGNIVPARLWSLLQDANFVGSLYKNLSQASRVDAKELAGCWSLLEVCVLNVT
ncbi:hypothetical protein M9H77_07694 [Catharanthus roseus]|uniref:Uncharacterized protein n=1 Tax=Catharanthus roseus TaxID=4058 RepID=A0ACC0BVM4_CATRO|nr:hypothetical protein M9H77_07694 [Catharanthus roseus]